MLPLLENTLIGFALSFIVVYFMIPVVIRIALKKRFVAEVEARSSHTHAVPALGGIAIFVGVILSCTPSILAGSLDEIKYALLGLIIIFLTGAKDDITPLSPKHKTIGLLIGITTIVLLGDIRLNSMYGLLGFYGEFPYWLSLIITIFTCFVITNAFNLIDGINSLAASLGVVMAISFGTWFFFAGMNSYALIALSLTGGLFAFLRYNITPASIFMGDSGSLVLGATSALFSISFIDACYSGSAVTPHCFNNPVAIAITFIIIPLFDTSRVFITRMLKGKSPFEPDRKHIHHLLIDTGKSHMEATMILVIVNIFFISLALWLDTFVELHVLIFIEICGLLALTFILHRSAASYSRKIIEKQPA